MKNCHWIKDLVAPFSAKKGMYINQIIYLFLIQFVKFAKLGTKNLQILCSMDWEFFSWNVGFIHDYFKDHYTFIIRNVCILSIAHAYTTIVGQKGHVLVVSISIQRQILHMYAKILKMYIVFPYIPGLLSAYMYKLRSA